jgi:hypothetical protein
MRRKLGGKAETTARRGAKSIVQFNEKIQNVLSLSSNQYREAKASSLFQKDDPACVAQFW